MNSSGRKNTPAVSAFGKCAFIVSLIVSLIVINRFPFASRIVQSPADMQVIQNIGMLSVSASPRDTVIFGWRKDSPVFVSVIMAFPFFNCRIASNASPCPFNPFVFSIPRNFTALEKYILPSNNRLTYLRSPNFTKSTLLLSILLTLINFA